jgi:hypothetical protein
MVGRPSSNMWHELYSTTNLLDSSCFSILDSDISTSQHNSGTPYGEIMPDPRRRTNRQRLPRPPPISGMNGTAIPNLGPTAQEHFLSAVASPSTTVPSIDLQKSGHPSPSHLLRQPGQLPGSRVTSAMLGSVLATELKDDIVEASDHFIERLFPNSRAPFNLDQNFFGELAKAGYWDSKHCFFTGMVYTEIGMAKWLNGIGRVMARVYGASDALRSRRCWSHRSCNLPPTGAHIRRKPDLVLIDSRDHQRFSKATQRMDWLHIRSFAEVTSQRTPPPRMIDAINGKSYLLFVLQHDRRFVPALSFIGSGRYILTVTDREGQIRYCAGSLINSGLEPANIFLTILTFLMFGEESDIGLDPNFTRDPTTSKLLAINVDGKLYHLSDRIYTLESLLGRGTNVWVVTRGGKRFVLKDSWIQLDRVESEVTHLQSMLGHSEIESMVPTFVAGGDVRINGIVDSTATYRGGGLLGRAHNQRVHRRVITTPVGAPLTSFQSKKEFIKVLETVVSGEFLTLLA